jgi:hypothetical protein
MYIYISDLQSNGLQEYIITFGLIKAKGRERLVNVYKLHNYRRRKPNDVRIEIYQEFVVSHMFRE